MDFKLIILFSLILNGCVKNPCLMYDTKNNPYKISKDKIEKTSKFNILIYKKCNE